MNKLRTNCGPNDLTSMKVFQLELPEVDFWDKRDVQEVSGMKCLLFIHQDL